MNKRTKRVTDQMFGDHKKGSKITKSFYIKIHISRANLHKKYSTEGCTDGHFQ